MALFQNENARNENSGLLGILSSKRMSTPKTVSLREKRAKYRRLMFFCEKNTSQKFEFPFFRINRFHNDSVHSTFAGGMPGIVFRSFLNWNVTQKNASCFSSVCSHSGIVPKECTLKNHILSYRWRDTCHKICGQRNFTKRKAAAVRGEQLLLSTPILLMLGLLI